MEPEHFSKLELSLAQLKLTTENNELLKVIFENQCRIMEHLKIDIKMPANFTTPASGQKMSEEFQSQIIVAQLVSEELRTLLGMEHFDEEEDEEE